MMDMMNKQVIGNKIIENINRMKKLLLGLITFGLCASVQAQVTERPPPGRVGTVSAGCTLYGPLFADA